MKGLCGVVISGSSQEALPRMLRNIPTNIGDNLPCSRRTRAPSWSKVQLPYALALQGKPELSRMQDPWLFMLAFFGGRIIVCWRPFHPPIPLGSNPERRTVISLRREPLLPLTADETSAAAYWSSIYQHDGARGHGRCGGMDRCGRDG